MFGLSKDNISNETKNAGDQPLEKSKQI